MSAPSHDNVMCTAQCYLLADAYEGKLPDWPVAYRTCQRKDSVTSVHDYPLPGQSAECGCYGGTHADVG
jgi:hypothetical protein